MATVCEKESETGHCEVDDPEPEQRPLTAAQRARVERNRLRARALHDARLAQGQGAPAAVPAAPLDSGGGFLLRPDSAPSAPRLAAAPPAPMHAHERPHCDDCGRPFGASQLLAAFGCAVCDECRDEDRHALLTRTEAKAEFLLKDCDLDAREPPLRFERRRNPHRGAHADMRLYLRAQVQARAELVWGGPEGLASEREQRGMRRLVAAAKADKRRLRALRLAARSSVLVRGERKHEHRWGEERRVGDTDDYRRECLDCGQEQTYEKM